MRPSRSSLGPVTRFLVMLAMVGLLLQPANIASARHPTTAAAAAAATVSTPNTIRVLAISVDGLNPRALGRLGADRLPHFFRLFRRGAGTYNARSQVELTDTLPNHTSMATGRRITASHGGHGVTWNYDRPDVTVHEAAGHRVESVFTAVHDAGGTSAVFATKSKFALFDRSWPKAVAKNVIRADDDAAAVRALRADLVEHRRQFTFLHLGLPDRVGHDRGWLSAAYLDAVVRVDRLLGQLFATRDSRWSLRQQLVVVLTADHGGVPGTHNHRDPARYDDYRVPFVIWGNHVDHGNLYRMNRDYQDPGVRRVTFSGTQPVRNGDVANLALDLLGLGPVPGSRWGRAQQLHWQR